MPQGKPLTATFVRTVKREGRYGDGRGGYGLSLLVQPMKSSGRLSKTWAQRLRINSKPYSLGLGSFPLTSLAEARELAYENARAVRQGKDPRKRKQAAAPTFSAAAASVIELRRDTWRDKRSAEQWESSLAAYAFPHIGKQSVAAVTRRDVMQAMEEIWTAKPETARRVLQRVSVIFDWAIANGYRTDNPAATARAALPKVNGAKKRQKALPHAQMAEALATVRASGKARVPALCFEFLTLTAVRSGEASRAQWREIDFESATWTIPAERMKAGREHRVPLSTRALAVLREAEALSDGSGYVFPSSRYGKPIADAPISKLLRDLGIAAVPHGSRSSFRDWVSEETDTPHAVAEAALAHTIQNRAEAAYARSDLFDRRRQLMEDWADYLS